MKPAIEHRDPLTELKLHPLHRHLPQIPGWEHDGTEFNALVEDIRLRGITTPILIDAEGRVLTGEETWRAARQLQLPAVPVLIQAGDPHLVIMAAELRRKTYPTASAKAYWAYTLIDAALRETTRLQVEKAIKTAQTGQSENFHSPTGPQWDAGLFVETFGINRHYWFDCKKLLGLFDKHPEKRDIIDAAGRTHADHTFQEYYEPLILSGKTHLGACIAGIAGSLSTKGKPKAAQLDLFERGMDTFILRTAAMTDPRLARPLIEESVGALTTVAELQSLSEVAAELHRQASARLATVKKQTQAKQ